MIDRNRSGTNQELRHVVTSLVVHGFHLKVCSTEQFHDPNDKCVYVCMICGKKMFQKQHRVFS